MVEKGPVFGVIEYGYEETKDLGKFYTQGMLSVYRTGHWYLG